jgi:hypothetical protein
VTCCTARITVESSEISASIGYGVAVRGNRNSGCGSGVLTVSAMASRANAFVEGGAHCTPPARNALAIVRSVSVLVSPTCRAASANA